MRWLKPNDKIHPPMIADHVRISAFVTVDSGYERPTRIGRKSFLMAHTHVGHDCEIGEQCELAAGAVLAGHVEVGDRVRIGVGACVKPHIKIGSDARIGAGAVVVDNVLPGTVVVGNPAREMNR